jgi:hypothetical protein
MTTFTTKMPGKVDMQSLLRQKRGRLNELKEFAVEHGLVVDEAVIQQSNRSLLRLDDIIDIVDGNKNGDKEISYRSLELDSSDLLPTVDRCILALQQIVSSARHHKRYNVILLLVGGLGTCVVVLCLVGIARGLLGVNVAPIVATFLGLLGAVVYGLFVYIGVVTQEEFDQAKEYAGYARLVLGALLGFVLYFAFSHNKFRDALIGFQELVTNQASTSPNSPGPTTATSNNENTTDALFLLLPFIAGYSTSLVVGILGRLTQMVEVTLGLEQSSKETPRISSKLSNKSNNVSPL